MGFLCASTSNCHRCNSTPASNCPARGMNGSMGEIVEEAAVIVTEDMMYVLVDKDVKDTKFTLGWAIRNSEGRKICILYIHQPAKTIPIMGTEFPLSYADPKEVKAFREKENRNVHQLLDTYSQICEKAGVRVETVHREMDSVEEGIVELISQHGITKLVMAATADKLRSFFSRKMVAPKSKKAKYVCLRAAISCHKGNVIYIREGIILDGVDQDVDPQPLQANLDTGTGQSSTAPDYRRPGSGSGVIEILAFSSPDGTDGISTPRHRLNAKCSSGADGISMSRPPVRAPESSYAEELRQRKENDESLARANEELRVALLQKSSQESEISRSGEAISRLPLPQFFFLILVVMAIFLIFVIQADWR